MFFGCLICILVGRVHVLDVVWVASIVTQRIGLLTYLSSRAPLDVLADRLIWVRLKERYMDITNMMGLSRQIYATECKGNKSTYLRRSHY